MQRADCWYLDLGMIDYREALNLQKKCAVLRKKNKIPDTVMLLEHFPVITLGRSGCEQNIVGRKFLEGRGVSFYKVDRGGDVTYHGPGQLVCYLILDLRNHCKDLHWYVQSLESILIGLLSYYGIEAARKKGYPGVWVGEEKIAAVGISVVNWITMHGLALNVDTELEYFKMIHPCGIKDKGTTSIAKILGRSIDKVELRKRFINCLSTEMKTKIRTAELSDLEGLTDETACMASYKESG